MISAFKLPIAKERILLLLAALIALEIILVASSLDFSCQQPVSAQSKSEAILRSGCRISLGIMSFTLSITDAVFLGIAFLICLIVSVIYAQEKLSRLKRS